MLNNTTNPPILSDETYRIESELGSGGGGVVYKAWHTRLQMYVVIKELKSGTASSIVTQRNEVEALKNVKSAYLPQVFDFITEGNRIFTVMEFVEGDSLDKWLERGYTFDQPQIVKWYGQLISALEAIHKQNVCHRDIKPANIMLMPSGDVCLIDFNAALVSGNDVKLVSRSLGYASPEQYEIYERFRRTRNAPIKLGNSGITAEPPSSPPVGLHSGATTVLVTNKTELVEEGSSAPSQQESSQITRLPPPPSVGNVDWKRSDIYSLGSTMYHLLTGKHPPERAAEVVPVSKLGRYSEGLVYIIEQSMMLNPALRFASAEILSDAVRNIHKHDTRWRVSRAKKIAAAIIIPVMLALFASTALLGWNVMAQEKEERYYSAVYSIENGDNAREAYAEALAMFWDRIDPYRAMAMRLWNDGDIVACTQYIEENLGNIAEFQAVPEAARDFGDIYYILGNCYFYQSGEPDYNAAKGNFEIAVRFVTDNPVYYRDYAISLARTGDIAEAETILAKAQALNLEADSLNLLNGEISFAKRNYSDATESFAQVIALTSDDYLRYRAYHTTDEMFKLEGRPERSVELLSGALSRIPLNRVSEMTERLADAYAKAGDYENAVALFEQLAESGAPQFHIMQNMVILFQSIGELEHAAETLDKMAYAFPQDYRVPMRQAYLEADIQSKQENEQRDYTLTKQYYDTATELYTSNLRPGEGDPEMQQLDLLIEQLKQYKWFD